MGWIIGGCILLPIFLGFCVLLGMLKDSRDREMDGQRATMEYLDSLKKDNVAWKP